VRPGLVLDGSDRRGRAARLHPGLRSRAGPGSRARAHSRARAWSGAGLSSRVGLRSRVTALFAAGAAVLSGVLAAGTFGLVHHYLLDQRQSSATSETLSDAALLDRDLLDAGARTGPALASLVGAQGSTLLLYRNAEWYSASVSLGVAAHTARPASLPPALVAMVSRGVPARQRVVADGAPAVVVGVPLASVDADFFEIHPLTELSSTLGTLATVLFFCAVATTAAGLLLGRWASRRLVRPLRDVTQVAAAIAGGALDQRLSATTDPDLGSLVTSFNEMVGALERRIKRDTRFASDVSHELRSPLTTMEATLELLETSEGALPPDGRTALRLLSGEIRRFSTMVQDLLEMARFDAGEGAAGLDLEELAVADLVVNTVEAYSQGSVPVTVEPEADRAWVMGDRRRLQRTLVNLLENASVHAGGALGVAVARLDGEARVTVEDAGPGVAPEERASIFERFYRGSAAGRRGSGTGTGLGLALVAEHVRAHQGAVEVADRPGGGSRFVLHLPLAAQDMPDVL
jgi:two-component system, OmpR family, sensor histidine kinase MtrB